LFLFILQLVRSSYIQIENLTHEFALLRGSIIIAQEILNIGLFEFEVESELTIEK
jgi:hypothetical protein